MGIIKRQGIKQSVVHYVATAIGAISVIAIYPYSEGVYALAGFLTASAALLAPFASLGANALTVRFFPKFNNEDQNHYGFLGIVLSYGMFSLFIFAGLAILFNEGFLTLLAKAGFNATLVKTYQYHIFILSILVVWTNVLTSYSSNFGRIVVPAIFNSLIYKIALPVLILLSIGKLLDEWTFSFGVLGYHLIGVIGLIGYVIYLKQWKIMPDLSFLDKSLVRSMFMFALFGIMGSLGSTLTYQIDRVMVPTLTDLKQADIYAITLFIGNSIEIPVRTIIAVTSPIIAKAWYDKDHGTIRSLYSKASLNLFLIGLYLFLGIWLCLEDLFHITGKYEALMAGKWVVFMVGATKLFDLATSVNGQIIGYSKFYYFNLFAIVILGVSNAFLNYFFIKTLGFGILGPAIASLISITLFNLVRVWFIQYKFKMHPFSWAYIYALTIGVAGYFLVNLIPNTTSHLVNILIKGSLITVLYIWPIYQIKLSEDFNGVIDGAIVKFKSFLNR